MSCSISCFELLAAHVLDLLAHLLVEHVAVEQRLGDGLAQVFQRLLGVVQVVVIHVLLLEAALQQVVGERVEQVLHAHLGGGLGNVFFVANEFIRQLAISCQRSVVSSVAVCMNRLLYRQASSDAASSSTIVRVVFHN